jgi:hypothetical protein
MRKTTTRLEHLSTRCTVKKINTSTALTPVDALGYLTFDKLQNPLFRGLCGFAMGRPPRVPEPMISPLPMIGAHQAVGTAVPLFRWPDRYRLIHQPRRRASGP